jgi:hypothetical protein
MEIKEKKTQGGRRINAGRKSVVDKKEAIVIYVKKSTVSALGIDFIKASTKDHIQSLIES